MRWQCCTTEHDRARPRSGANIDLPLLGIPSIAGYQLLRRRSLVKRLNADGPLSSSDIDHLACVLARALPPAV